MCIVERGIVFQDFSQKSLPTQWSQPFAIGITICTNPCKCVKSVTMIENSKYSHFDVLKLETH